MQLTEMSPKEGDIRLIGGSFSWEGRVEIYISGAWGTVGDTSTYINEARVVCRQLGYETYSKCKLKMVPELSCKIIAFPFRLIF